MTALMQANRQWAARPADERFTSLTSLDEHCRAVRAISAGKTVSTRSIEAVPADGDNSALQLVGPNGGPVDPTHWAFGQLAARAGAPAGYLRSLPSPLAADCINVGLLGRDIDDIGVLLRKTGHGPAELSAVTGPNYGRIWNADITRALVQRFGDGVTGEFKVPGEFGQRVDITAENTTLYASDRDMFVFLADEERRIPVHNRRHGKAGELSRGFFVWNSEVGSTTLGIATFLFDYVCCNRIVWGAEGYKEIKVRHTSGAPDRWIHEVTPAIRRYAESSAAETIDVVQSAQRRKIDDVADYLARRKFTKAQINGATKAHEAEEGRPIRTVWDAVTGLTAHARAIPYQDERVSLERAAGALLG